jgi:hypothetical protein
MTDTMVLRGSGCVAPNSRRLRRTAAAQYIRDTHGIPCSPKTLAKQAVVGGGPPYRKAGRFPLYEISDLDQWAESKIGPLVHSSAELKVAPASSLPQLTIDVPITEPRSLRTTRKRSANQDHEPP